MRYFLYASFVIFFLIPSLLLAQTDEFNIRLFIGSDTTAPTTPVITDAVPVSPYQIDITWGAVSDDVYVSGYRIYRDAVLLATTTLTTFSDTGLTPTTTYSYTVDAFDYSGNVSSTSIAVATTTLDVPVVIPPTATSTPSDTATSQGTRVVMLRGTVAIETTSTEATIKLSSYGPTKYVIKYGRTTAYELGTVSNNVLAREHTSILTGLEPGTVYYVEILLQDDYGQQKIVAQETFTTKASLRSDNLTNVTDFYAVVDQFDVRLFWNNPNIPFRSVRIVRSPLFYPQTPTDGVVVYDGQGEFFVDEEALAMRSPYYYTIFVMGEYGGVSTGAVALATLALTVPGQNGQTETTPAVSPVVQLPDIPVAGETPVWLLPSDIFFTYQEKTLTFDSVEILPVGELLLISIPYDAVPKHLKSILVSVQNPTQNNTASVYLLKLNPDGTAYTTTLTTSRIAGQGNVMIEVFDYELEVVRRLSRRVVYQSDLLQGDGGSQNQFGLWLLRYWFAPLPVLLIVFIFYWWFVVSRRREDNR